ncbi:hypothetical protein C5167_021001 [Papaver somniferum]|uniref:Uncharacterized protein n=1 Tax=Papaver somniferum TaxID=3469 RepID=A0A4Y7IUL2_PAPSO|nr:hypothetical protein C5167_021001 [Papaver somniferum]
MVSKVCDAPILDDPSLRGASSAVSLLSYAVSSDYQRKLLSLGKENTKLKAENSTNVELLRVAREINDEIIDVPPNEVVPDIIDNEEEYEEYE